MEETEQDNLPNGTTPYGNNKPKSVGEVRLPVRATVLNEDGKKIGKVRRSVWYDGSEDFVGEFVRENDESVCLYNDKEHSVRGGYVDGNNNVLTYKREYIATLRYTQWWIIIIIAALLAALVLFTSLFAAYYLRASEDGSYYPVLFVADDSGTAWNQSQNLPVFSNPEFGDSVIAPGLKGSYKFSFRNDNADAIAYNLAFSCENDYGIGVGYRLLRDNVVIAGVEDYVSAEEISCANLMIEAGSASRFELEWYWRHDDAADTAAGENSARYVLNISFTAWVV